LIEKLGNPIIYTAEITKAIVERRHQEFTNAPKLRFEIVKHGSVVRISEHFTAKFFNVDHTIPDALGFVLDTPAGKMVSFGDFRLTTDNEGKPVNTEIFKEIGGLGVHSLFVDSTSIQREGFSLSEHQVEKNLEDLIKGARGRVIIATFSSLLTRIKEIIKIAERHGRKVAVNGRSMKDNVQIARDLGYFKLKSDQLINVEDIHKYKDEKLLILTTGAQGEANAGLMRIVNGDHRLVHLKPTDTVIFSSSVVPGNERSVQGLQDNIARQVDEVYNYQLLDIHSGGHAHREDIALVLGLVRPKFVIPIHAYYFLRKTMIKIAKEVGMDPSHVILMDNGQVARITKDSFTVTDEKVPAFYVMVDGLGVGDVEEVVLRDRRNLAQEGMIVIILTVDKAHGGKLLKNPDIISRGFIYLKENQVILDEIRKRIRGLVARIPNYQQTEPDYVKTLIRDQIGQFVYNKTRRRPMILPVILEI
jgi:ribonuclease J